MNSKQSDIDHFEALAADWWNPHGPLKTLHDINPLRLSYIEQNCSLKNQSVLDIGCGGGLLTEALAKLGADVTGIDMSQAALNAARAHQKTGNLTIHYLLSTAEALADAAPHTFDVITCLELLEHVPEPMSVINAIQRLIKPNGHVFFSTINRNTRSYLSTIVGAEYLLKLIPKNTHDFAQFIRPSELSSWSEKAGLSVQDIRGLTYHPFTRQCSLSQDVRVNYLMHCRAKMVP